MTTPANMISTGEKQFLDFVRSTRCTEHFPPRTKDTNYRAPVTRNLIAVARGQDFFISTDYAEQLKLLSKAHHNAKRTGNGNDGAKSQKPGHSRLN